MTMIRLTTLGTTDLRNASGESIGSVIRQPRRFALLVFLALESRRGFVRRDRVLGTFWPEVSTDQGRRALSQALHYLRQSLGPAALIGRGQDDLKLDLGIVACDACLFLDAIDADDPDRALRLLGGDFLPGFFCSGVPEFDGWLELARTEIRRAASEAAWTAAERAAARREWVTAAALARRAAELAGGQEPSVRRLMAFLAGLGDRAGALEAYEMLARHLARDLELEPSEQTRRLAAEIRELEQATTSQPGLDPAPPPQPDPVPTLAVGTGSHAAGWKRIMQRFGEPVRSVVVTGILMLGFIGLWGLRRADEPAGRLDGAGLLVEEARGGGELAPRLTAELVRQLSGLNQIEVLVDGSRSARAPRAAELALRSTFAGPADALTATVAIVDRATGKTIASSRIEGGATDSAATALAAGIARFARVTVGAELERRRHELAQVAADVRLDLETVRAQLLAADSFASAGQRQLERLKLAGADSLLAGIQAREPDWIEPVIERAEAAYRLMWAYLLPPQAEERHARAHMKAGIALASRAVGMDERDARGYELRGVLGYFLWASTPRDSAAVAPLPASVRTDLERATQLSREASLAWHYLSVIQFQNGDYAAAYIAATRALRADQFLTNAFSNQVRLFWSALELGDYPAAARWCRVLDRDSPGSAEGEYCTLVLSAWAPKYAPMSPAGADSLVARALLSPDADPARLRAAQAVILAHAGRAAAAHALLDQIAAASGDASLAVDIAWVHTALGEHARARRLLDEYVRHQPEMFGAITRSARFAAYRQHPGEPSRRTVATWR